MRNEADVTTPDGSEETVRPSTSGTEYEGMRM